MFLETLTAASLAALADGASVGVAVAQTNSDTSAGSVPQDPFDTAKVKVAGNIIFTRRCGNGPAILLVHGFPRTSLMWRFLSRSRCQRVTCSALPGPCSTTPSGTAPSARKFSKSTSRLTAIRLACMESVRNIAPRQQLTSNTIVLTRKSQSESPDAAPLG